MELWITFTFCINDKYINVVAKDYETAKIKADEKYKKLYEKSVSM